MDDEVEARGLLTVDAFVARLSRALEIELSDVDVDTSLELCGLDSFSQSEALLLADEWAGCEIDVPNSGPLSFRELHRAYTLAVVNLP